MRQGSKSAACWTCKRRKVKCDEARPGCQRCRKANLECAGYKPLHKFINHTIGYRQPVTLIIRPLATSDPSVLSTETSIAFLSAKLFPGQLPTQSEPETSWILSALRHDESSMVLNSVSCLARLYFMRIHGQTLGEVIRQDYVDALGMVRSHSAELTRLRVAPFLISTLCLMFFEMISPTTLGAVKYHSDAISTIVLQLGPQAFSTPPLHTHYLLARSVIIGRDLLHGIRCELAKEEWRTVPWENGYRKTLEHDLWDIIADTCDLVATTSELLFLRESPIAMDTARAFLVSTIRNIAEWRWNWHERYGTCFYETDVNLSTTFMPQPVHASSAALPIFYQDVIRSRELMLYNTVMLHLLRLAWLWGLNTCAIFDEMRPIWQTPSQCELSLPLRGLTTASVVSDIARSIDYHLFENRHQASLSFLPLAINALHRSHLNSATRKWLRSLTDRLVQVSGFDFFKMVCAGDANNLYLLRIQREIDAAKFLR